MSDIFTRITPLGVEQRIRYTKDEIRGFWGKYPIREIGHGKFLRLPQIHEPMALELSAIWLRQYNADPSTFAYSPETQEMYFYFTDLGQRAAWQDQLRAYELVGADERGPLFSDPDAREIDPLPLLKALQHIQGVDGHYAQSISEAIAKAYGK